ncbi:MAG: glycosyltransferase family 4 protein [Bacteroidales bacterium]|nr:glycosyltransferase family 4 protein [Bacteroidales bacterium]
MKIVILSIWYSDKMGYIENCLPKALAKLGHEVHVITSTAQVYYDEPNYDKIYKLYLGDRIQKEGTCELDGFMLHRLPFGTIQKKIYLKSIRKKLKEINPDIVQTFDAFSFLTLQGAYYKLFFKYKFFTANHIVASVFPLYKKDTSTLIHKISFYFTRTLPGKMISFITSRCYPATVDALEIAINFYGIPKNKAKLACLGVDTDYFHPSSLNAESLSEKVKRKDDLGFSGNELLCIYTGRFTEGKNPLCLAKAIDKLVELNEPFKAIFLGDGPQLNEIKSLKGCYIHKFVPYHELPDYYRIADIGIWPRQESTSMIDATACGLPIIISNLVKATERIEGNGLTYIENDVDDLVRVLMKMKDEEIRNRFSRFGVEKIREKYSWDIIAKDRVRDYQSFLNK